MSNYILPTPATNLQTKIWLSLERELDVKTTKSGFWQKWFYGGAVSVLVVALIVTKSAIRWADRAQFNDLDSDLALAEQTMIEDLELSNLEWESISLEGDSYESSY